MIDTIRHIAIIPDGNRRWAKERGLPAIEGHRQGLMRFTELASALRDLGIPYGTFFAFSTENSHRPPEEVAYLMDLFTEFASANLMKLKADGVAVSIIGDTSAAPQKLKDLFIELKGISQDAQPSFHLAIAFNYGGRDEILRAVARAFAKGHTVVDSALLSQYLDAPHFPDPDLIIRTGKVKRLSHFLTWQSIYSELYFTDTYFPDFDRAKLLLAIEDFEARERRFGK
ncbi:MAG: di-trans,poly-cis-decaprenylcistransferase [Parcubacteria group bacterium]|nr:di-trans,poly-cis-decaprenylcistransferase [Parcubacteria group bacterium]